LGHREGTELVVTPNRVIVLDGYDGSGKTTLAKMLVQKLGGTYVKSYNDTLGRLIWGLFADDEYALASLVARTACRKELDAHRGESWLVYDRHWMTMFTLLPPEYHAEWIPLPTTFRCHAPVDVTVARLHARGEKLDTPREVHRQQIERFETVSERHDVPSIDTSAASPAECLQGIMAILP
jgi:thymidylate kinase